MWRAVHRDSPANDLIPRSLHIVVSNEEWAYFDARITNQINKRSLCPISLRTLAGLAITGAKQRGLPRAWIQTTNEIDCSKRVLELSLPFPRDTQDRDRDPQAHRQCSQQIERRAECQASLNCRTLPRFLRTEHYPPRSPSCEEIQAQPGPGQQRRARS